MILVLDGIDKNYYIFHLTAVIGILSKLLVTFKRPAFDMEASIVTSLPISW